MKYIIAITAIMFSTLAFAETSTRPTPDNAQVRAMSKMPISMVAITRDLLAKAYVISDIKSKCKPTGELQDREYMVVDDNYTNQRFDLLYIQNKLLTGLNNHAAEGINRLAWAKRSELITEFEERTPSRFELKNVKDWCKFIGTEIIKKNFIPFGTDVFISFVRKKDSYLRLSEDFDALGQEVLDQR